MPRPRKVRIAPTPSGYLHRGNLANFLLNAALAGPSGETLLRIDDLDRARCRPAYLEDIFRVVHKLELKVTEGPVDVADFERSWSQKHRMSIYSAALAALRDHPLVFACPCTRKELVRGEHAYGCREGRVEKDAPGVAWRINTRALDQPVIIPDLYRKTPFTVNLHAEIPDFAVRTKAGLPSYQLACTVDDLHFDITHVGRGVDLLASTAAQVVVSDLLGYAPLLERIDFVHHVLVTAAGGKKLSKSAGAQSAPLELTAELIAEVRQLVTDWTSAAEK
ncbi:glutamate--tRNA ligase family protein [Neolewinella antarctica]|uniref:Glutamyl/glutaminyl-tRNA synthetase n=1 Tax=Neolewinella antarctica TaxID=442734 RepID=A0ABX0XB24_9BACT|nr:glutamate--tRNA ligase family protein [Neolewinella antarctica]NJC26445.1 glutamyl/glutaminyl-tRNA synthetase [Neolewinella antarctica]